MVTKVIVPLVVSISTIVDKVYGTWITGCDKIILTVLETNDLGNCTLLVLAAILIALKDVKVQTGGHC